MKVEHDFVVAPDRPDADDVRALLVRHLTFSHEHSPPEHAFALDVSGLLEPDVSFYSLRESGVLLGFGALRTLDASTAEIKSMHTAAEARGRGAARTMLTFLLGEAAARGCARVYLETGSMDAFAPARALYASAGFVACPPFADYEASDYSTFMVCELGG